MNVFPVRKHPRQASISLLCGVLVIEMAGCSTPVTEYKATQLFSPSYAEVLNGKTQINLSKSKLCQGFGQQWDSVLLVKPYVPTSVVKSLSIDNYAEISDQVYGRSLGDDGCTLFFVKSGRYVGYSVVSTSWSNINKPGPGQPTVWLTKSDAQHLFMRKKDPVSAADTVKQYAIALAPQK